MIDVLTYRRSVVSRVADMKVQLGTYLCNMNV